MAYGKIPVQAGDILFMTIRRNPEQPVCGIYRRSWDCAMTTVMKPFRIPAVRIQ